MEEPKIYTVPNPAILNDVKKFAELRYTISQIATMISMPAQELRVRVMDPNDPFFNAYHAGILLSQAKYRMKMVKAAEGGSIRAVAIVEGWERKQREEELGGYV